MYGIGLPELLIIIILIIPIILLQTWFIARILSKAGFSGWFALISLLPIVNIIALWVFAFIPWPSVDQKT